MTYRLCDVEIFAPVDSANVIGGPSLNELLAARGVFESAGRHFACF